MVLHRETLPYEIRKTACELFFLAGQALRKKK